MISYVLIIIPSCISRHIKRFKHFAIDTVTQCRIKDWIKSTEEEHVRPRSLRIQTWKAYADDLRREQGNGVEIETMNMKSRDPASGGAIAHKVQLIVDDTCEVSLEDLALHLHCTERIKHQGANMTNPKGGAASVLPL